MNIHILHVLLFCNANVVLNYCVLYDLFFVINLVFTNLV